MKNKRCVIIMGIILYCFSLHGQNKHLLPDYFRSPVDYLYQLSGNFCELRESHFHAGIDIKPSRKGSKEKIYSIGDGYISRIRVSPGGYGRVIYIDHPDVGYTSVYAHLDVFYSNIEEQVKQYQMSQESYEVDFLPEPHVFPVKKGDIIGFMGNTGYSFGKHLHFEIRDTKTEQPVNPLHFGMQVPDSTLPSIISLAFHGLDSDYNKILDVRMPVGTNVGNIIEVEEPIILQTHKVGIALQTFDKSDGTYNKLGIYGFHMYVDDSLIFSYHLDKVSFDQSRQVIGFYDFQVKKKENKIFTLCYKYPGNHLEMLKKTGTGIIEIFPDKDRYVRIEVEDFNRNKRTIKFFLRKSEEPPDTIYRPSLKKIFFNESETIEHKKLTVIFKENSLFRNIGFDVIDLKEPDRETIYQIHSELEPVKNPIEISIRPDTIVYDKQGKYVIVKMNAKGSKINYGGRWKDEKLTTRIREFGKFTIAIDTIGPIIKSINFNKRSGKKTAFRFKLADNMPVRGEDVEPLKYKVYINDKFVISPYHLRTGILEVPLSNLPAGEHLLHITAIDHSNNMSEFRGMFIKK